MDLILFGTFFSNNMLQTDLKSHLRFKRYRIFKFKSRKDSSACKLLVGALWDDVTSDSWLALLFFPRGHGLVLR